MSERLKAYPFLFEPIYKQKVWGGRNLTRLGRDLPGEADCLIGESWEIADLSSTSASGGGGGAEHSVIRNGPMAGRALHEVIEMDRQAVLGGLELSDEGGFPLLVKFLDAQANLSVQVHPSEAYAKAHPDAHLKSEAWYVVHAEAGAVIYKGVKEGTTADEFRQAVGAGTVEQLLIEVPVKAGDCHYLPSGTCHALGAGVLVAEVQTPSDTTFRVYDWGREGRQLHLDEAMACIDFGPAQTGAYEPGYEVKGEWATVKRTVKCEYFQIDRCVADAGFEESMSYAGPTIWMCLAGGGEVHDVTAGSFAFGAGDTMLIPPGLSESAARLAAGTLWLSVSFPKAQGKMLA